jgi:hypothetical protein
MFSYRYMEATIPFILHNNAKICPQPCSLIWLPTFRVAFASHASAKNFAPDAIFNTKFLFVPLLPFWEIFPDLAFAEH